MDPNFAFAYVHFGYIYSCKGLHEEAIVAYQKAIELGIPVVGELGSAYAMSGERAKAEKILHELEERSKQEHISKISIARIYEALGEIDKAFEEYEKAYEERDSVIYLLKTWPGIGEKTRSHPRFTALLKKMGLE